MPTRVTPSRQAVRANRDGQILEASIRIFAEKGYAAASLQDVADAVGLLKGSLYHYISSKESLLYRIFQEAHEQAKVMMDAVDELNLSPEEHIREFLKRLALFYVVNRERASLYFSEWRNLTGEERNTVLRQQREFRSYIRQMLERAQDAGATRGSLDVKIATSFLLAALNGVPSLFRTDSPHEAEQLAGEIANLACAAVLNPALLSAQIRPM